MELRERYHIAKLMLSNVRFLHAVQTTSSHDIQELYQNICRENNHQDIPAPINQSTFISMAYICLVWLWEAVKLKLSEGEFNKFESSLLNTCMPPKENWVVDDARRRPFTPNQILRVMRNALSHGNISISDTEFVFKDKSRQPGDKAELTVTWEFVGRLCEQMIFNLSPFAYPKK